ncbi:MAG: ABC transporter permease, partial [Nonomuraea sp.]|nr:ABC transporter permease [Nonomuraea sp.]
MSPAFRLGGLELQRFARARLTRAALVAVVLIPLLYSGLYLWSFWNPQGNIGNIPVALVVLDDGDLGRELADNLIDRQIFAWKETDPADAEKGVQEGTYYGSLTIPADFTANLKSPSKDGPPQPAYLQVHVDQGKSYLFETIAKAVFAEVQATVGKSAISDYLDRIFVSFGKLHDSTLKAARGADQLADGAGDARSGAGRLQDGLGTARQGTAKLSDGLRTAGTGASTLAQGLGSAKKGADDLLSGAYKLHRGAGTLTQGLVTAKDGTSKLAAGAVKLDQGAAKLAAGNAEAFQQVDRFRPVINQLADQAVPFLRSHTGDIRQLAEFVNVAASFLADCLADLPARIQADRVKADKAYKALKTYLDTHPDLDPQLRTLLEAAEKAAKRLAELADWLDALVGEHLADLKQLERDALGVARLARQLANLAPRLAGLIDQARDKFNELDNGLAKLADGAAKLHQGTGEAVKGATKLDAGMTKLVDGASKLDTGLGALVAGANKLDIGLGKLTGGANKLNAGLGQLGQGAGSLDSG